MQLVEAGWYYDPTLDTTDGATCAYCSLSLDAWDIGDDPMEEHRRRAPDCLFFALKELYHPAPKVAPKKGKRASTRTSNASTTTKPTRGKKRVSEQIDDSISTVAEPTRGKKRTSEQIDITVEEIKPKATRGRKRASTQIDDTISSVTEKPARGGRKRASTQVDDTIDSIEKPTRGKKKAAEPLDSTMNDNQDEQPPLAPAPKPKAKKAAPKAKRTSTASSTTKTRGKKRTSDQIEDVEVVDSSPKRIRHSSVSSFPDSLLAGTPKKAPTELADPEPLDDAPAEPEIEELEADISSLPASLLVGTPKKTPTRMTTPEQAQQVRNWDPIDIDAFFGNTEELQALINDVVIDAGLDAIVPVGATTEDLQAAVLSGLTKSEKEMSVEQWVLYNAKRGEEKLRQACEKQVSSFEAEAMRARDTIESLPTY